MILYKWFWFNLVFKPDILILILLVLQGSIMNDKWLVDLPIMALTLELFLKVAFPQLEFFLNKGLADILSVMSQVKDHVLLEVPRATDLKT